ncbi:MspI family type II restriction endonuclease [Psychrobacter sp. SCQQ22]|uniref:MspI family type II restriction endonuclease n=1 Tax=Psychrobacter sp. SCQQ22 TaxID=2792059 RepID=UPI0018CEBBC9|nr:MspI family type II restriction endonuclease [Psychrobacter sp. SCQQ22]MBH0086598.1 MspI family type II restriction endonuclease [Psychrobacter sp. SCQQ22]
MSLIDVQNNSHLLNQLYNQYDLTMIAGAGHLTDKLGDVYEHFVLKIFEDKRVAMSWAVGTVERYIVDALLFKLGFTFNDIVGLKASNDGIPLTARNGTPKTDVYLTFDLTDGSTHLTPISVKQSTVRKVAIAEYRVEDIVTALNIQDPTLIQLLIKHQRDASAINFSLAEKLQLTALLAPHADSLIRWCLTLNPNRTVQDILHPEYLIRFSLNHPSKFPNQRYCFNLVEVYSIDEYIYSIRYTANGALKAGGFGTGLSWTYATGSKGTKIQLKG